MKTDIKEQDVMVTWQNLNPGAIVTGGRTDKPVSYKHMT